MASSLPFPSSGDKKGKAQGALYWHVLGGNNKNRIGGNCGLCVFEETDGQGRVKKRAVLVDAGALSGDPKYPEHDALADMDTIIPDLTRYLRKKDDPTHQPETVIDSIYLTHSHGDHLGAIPFLILMGYEIPKIHATPYTAKRLEQELANAGVPSEEWPDIAVFAPGKPITEGPMTITAFWVSHSTPQSVGFYIETPEGNILNPGDFKLDPTVLWGPAFSDDQFGRIVKNGVDLLLMDSTGADRDITPTTEQKMRDAVQDIMDKNHDKRMVIAVMGGFEENLASVARVAAEAGRDIWIAGWSHEQSLAALKQTGMSLEDCVGVPCTVRMLAPGKAARDLAEADPSKSVVIVTGAQGKPNAVLTRAVEGRHNALKLDPENDMVLFCAPSIPGQEGGRERLFALLRRLNIPFLTRKDADLYPHAHARLPEIRAMADKAQPKTVLPIHGDITLRTACEKAMQDMNLKTIAAGNGAVVRVTKGGAQVAAPENAQDPKMIGFKTLQGGKWNDRHYMMVKTDKPAPVPANDAQKKKPRIFDIGK